MNKSTQTPDRGACVWLTGLSGSGKTTLATLLCSALERRGVRTTVLDGDVFRATMAKNLGFSKADRLKNQELITRAAAQAMKDGSVVIVAAISPYQCGRDSARALLGSFTEVFVNCPLEVCARRDPKGLYQRAMAGEIKGFTGVDDPYEPPSHPEVEVFTGQESPQESLERILACLAEQGCLCEESPGQPPLRAVG